MDMIFYHYVFIFGIFMLDQKHDILYSILLKFPIVLNSVGSNPKIQNLKFFGKTIGLGVLHSLVLTVSNSDFTDQNNLIGHIPKSS